MGDLWSFLPEFLMILTGGIPKIIILAEFVSNNKEEVLQDLEGMQTMYNLGKNMAWILKCIESGKQNNINKPVNKTVKTNFIR